MKRLIETYPRWRRALAWVVWKNRPFRWVAGLLWTNPYRRVVAVVRPGSDVLKLLQDQHKTLTGGE